VNMTFLYPYSLLARGWGREHRELARADLVMGMVVPFTIVTSLVVIVSAATLHEGFSGKSISPIEAAGTLGSLLGPVAGRVAFDLGLLAMLLTTITLHMVGYRLATLLPAPGVLGSVYWTSLSIWVAVPTSIVAGFLLPLAYVGFIRLQASSAYLGSDRPRGVKGALWLAGMAIATLVVVVFLGWYLVEKGPAFLEMLRPSAETAA
jgi:manganese transport protein